MLIYKLRNYDSYRDFRYFSFDENQMKIHEVESDSEEKTSSKGFYCKGAQELLGLFYKGNCWFFFFGENAFKVDEIRGIARSYNDSQHVRIKVGLAKGNDVNSSYCLSGEISDDPTPFIEDEDFDFGMFFENVVRNPERQHRISQNNEEN